MSSLAPRPAQPPVSDGTAGAGKPLPQLVVHTATVIFFGVVGGVLAVLGGAVLFPAQIQQPLAMTAIGVIGSIAGSGLTVLTLVVRSERRAKRDGR